MTADECLTGESAKRAFKRTSFGQEVCGPSRVPWAEIGFDTENSRTPISLPSLAEA